MAKKVGGAVPQFGGKVGGALQGLNQKAMNFGQQTAQGTLGNTAGQLAGAATRSANFGNQTANRMNDVANRFGQQGAQYGQQFGQQSADLGRQANLGPGGAIWGQQTPNPMQSFGSGQWQPAQSYTNNAQAGNFGQAQADMQRMQAMQGAPGGGFPTGGKSSAPPPNYGQMQFGARPGAGAPMPNYTQSAMAAGQGGQQFGQFGPPRKSPVSVPNMPQRQVNTQQLSSQMRNARPTTMAR